MKRFKIFIIFILFLLISILTLLVLRNRRIVNEKFSSSTPSPINNCPAVSNGLICQGGANTDTISSEYIIINVPYKYHTYNHHEPGASSLGTYTDINGDTITGSAGNKPGRNKHVLGQLNSPYAWVANLNSARMHATTGEKAKMVLDLNGKKLISGVAVQPRKDNDQRPEEIKVEIMVDEGDPGQIN